MLEVLELFEVGRAGSATAPKTMNLPIFFQNISSLLFTSSNFHNLSQTSRLGSKVGSVGTI